MAHTDDEVLGMGGTIRRHIDDDDSVFVLSMTDGVSARQINDKNAIKIRQRAAINASRKLGFTWLSSANFPDNAMDSIALLDVIKFIEKTKKQINPNIIYTHSSADLNIDHRIVSQATLTAFRSQPGEIWREIRTFEVPSATDFGHKSITNAFYPNLFIDISDTWHLKLEAIKEYELEMKAPPHSRSMEGLENLAKYRGNQAGLNYAEAFEIIKKIDR